MLNSEEIKPVAIAIVKLRLSECIGKGVSQLEENSTKYRVFKIRNNFLEWVRNDLKTFLSLAMPNLYCLDVTR